MKYKIELMKMEELEGTLALVKDVFNEFEAPEYSEEGIKNFYQFANYENIKESLHKDLEILITKENSRIVGMIAFRDYSHIAMLFVDKEFQKQGIATKLIEEMKSYCRTNNKELEKITVNSSPYAVDFYHKLGFENVDGEKVVNGIKFTPMNLQI